jgi:hypothetical protein
MTIRRKELRTKSRIRTWKNERKNKKRGNIEKIISKEEEEEGGKFLLVNKEDLYRNNYEKFIESDFY